MNFTISTKELSTKLQALNKVINTKNALTALDCILFSVKDEGLTLIASDGENMLTSKLPLISNDGTGDFCIKASNILSVVKELGEQPLDFNVDLQSYKVEISFLNGSFSLTAAFGGSFPIFQGLKKKTSRSFDISAKDLVSLLEKSLWATAKDSLRLVLNGICLNFVEDGLDFVATDSHKLSKITFKGCKVGDVVPGEDFDDKSEKKVEELVSSCFVLPKKPATLLLGALTKDDSMVKVSYNDRCALFTFADGELECRLIEGRYPPYNSVFPKDNNDTAFVDKLALTSSLRRVLPFTSDNTTLIKLLFNDTLNVSGEDIDFNTSAHETVACQYNGKELNIGVKGSVLIEALKYINSDNLVFKLSDPNRAIILQPENNEETTEHTLLIMPMMI